MRQLIQRFITRVRGWYAWRRPAAAALPLLIPSTGPIFREVSSTGVRVFSLCGSCGARLEMSATLCGACARRRSPSSPF
jgi:ribosomal protein L40E